MTSKELDTQDELLTYQEAVDKLNEASTLLRLIGDVRSAEKIEKVKDSVIYEFGFFDRKLTLVKGEI